MSTPTHGRTGVGVLSTFERCFLLTLHFCQQPKVEWRQCPQPLALARPQSLRLHCSTAETKHRTLHHLPTQNMHPPKWAPEKQENYEWEKVKLKSDEENFIEDILGGNAHCTRKTQIGRIVARHLRSGRTCQTWLLLRRTGVWPVRS